MRQLLRYLLLVLLLSSAILLLVVASPFQATARPATGVTRENSTPTSTTRPAFASPSALPAVVKLPSRTPSLTPTAPTTLPPMATPPATPTPTGTPLPPLCPLPTPERLRPVRGLGRLWPQPEPGPAAAHLWLASPVEQFRLPQLNRTFPYGSDGEGIYLLHNGVDAWGPLGRPVLAAAPGMVVVAGADTERLWGFRCDWYGHLVVVELDRRWRGQAVYILYGHVLDIVVEPGQRVAAGEPIAAVGVGGAAVEPHLHLEVRLGENSFWSTRNPALWLDPGPGRGVLAGRLVSPEGQSWAGVSITVTGLTAGTQDRTTWTYLDHDLIHPDEELAENFAVGQLPAGRYAVSAELLGLPISHEVTITAGQVSLVELQTR